MTKKKIIIILVIVFSIFTAIMIAIFVRNNNKKNTSITENPQWAVNEVKEQTKEEEEEKTISKNVGNVTFNCLENLTYEQQTDKESMIYKIMHDTEVDELTSRHGELNKVDVLDSSTVGLTYVNCTFTDDYEEVFVLAYDEYETHSYMNCQSLDTWEYYHNGSANKG